MNHGMRMSKEFREKLQNAQWVCNKCGKLYGEFPKGHVATLHYNTCDVCGEKDVEVTESRDYGYFYKALGDKHYKRKKVWEL